MRHYVRKAGYKQIPIKSRIGSKAFEDEYEEALDQLARQDPPKPRPRKPRQRPTISTLPKWLKTRKVSGVYFVKGGERLKIGYSANIKARIQELQVGSPAVIEFVGALVGAEPETEKRLHDEFAEYRTHGEWFEYGARLADFIALVRTNQLQGLTNLPR